MSKFKAICEILKCKHFYLITADQNLICNEERSTKSDLVTIAKMIALEWNPFWKNVYLDNLVKTD